MALGQFDVQCPCGKKTGNIQINFKCIKDLNIKWKAIKLLDVNIGEKRLPWIQHQRYTQWKK